MNKLSAFQLQNWEKLKTASLNLDFTGSYKAMWIKLCELSQGLALIQFRLNSTLEHARIFVSLKGNTILHLLYTSNFNSLKSECLLNHSECLLSNIRTPLCNKHDRILYSP